MSLQTASAAKPEVKSPAATTAVMGTYARQDVVFERGEGMWLQATNGDRYLDCTAGIAVNLLGHAHPRLAAALNEQSGKLWHTSNLYRVAGQERLAEKLAAATFAEKVFFCNSGAEACEGAIKLARRYHFANGKPERWHIITFKGAFHGRTLATIAAAGNEKYLEGFGTPTPGFKVLETINDLALVEKAITPEVGAIMVEPVQGEGGIRACTPEFIRGLRALCDKHGLLLVLDEIQSGMGRTGRLFAHEWAGITPDVMAIAKGIGGGFPVGAFMATAEAAKGMVPGTHGSTFGGNLLAMAVGNAVMDVVLEPDFMPGVEQRALRFKQSLAQLKDENADMIEEIRGQGLMLGLKLKPPVGDVVKACMGEKLLIVSAGENVIRIFPSLIATDEELGETTKRLGKAFAQVRKAKS